HVTVPSAPTFFSSSGTGRSGVMMEMLAVAYGSKHVPVIVTVEPASYELASVEALAGTPVHAPGGVGAPAAGGASTTAGAAAHVIASRSPAPSRTVAWPRRTNIGTPQHGRTDQSYCMGHRCIFTARSVHQVAKFFWNGRPRPEGARHDTGRDRCPGSARPLGPPQPGPRDRRIALRGAGPRDRRRGGERRLGDRHRRRGQGRGGPHRSAGAAGRRPPAHRGHPQIGRAHV